MSRRKLDPETVTGVLADNQLNDGRRKIKLTKADRQRLNRQRKAEHAAVLFLDLDKALTYPKIAEELEISVHALKDLIKTPEFDEAYNKLFMEAGHDPRYKAAQGALADMLPAAIKQLSNLITSSSTSAGIRLKAIEKVISLNGLQNIQPMQSDRQELVQFLVNNEINLKDVKINLPFEYAEVEGEVVEGDYRNTNLEPSDNQGKDEPQSGNGQAKVPLRLEEGELENSDIRIADISLESELQQEALSLHLGTEDQSDQA